MQKQILVLNVGSSSLKFSVFQKNKELISGICDRLGSKKSYLSFEYKGQKQKINEPISDHRAGMEKILEILKAQFITFHVIAHRVVHGGSQKTACLIDEKVEKDIQKFGEFAPLHNPFELEVIRICKEFNKPQYAVFDTGFFSGLPKKAYTYPIPVDIAKKHHIRKYGFHGSSHKFISHGEKGKVITCHLGNGASISAIKNGKVVDTSMGLTPLEGLMMGTRSGDIDPSLVLFLESNGYDTYQILNFESGFKAFSPYTDFRDILENQKEPLIKLSLDIFLYRIVKYIGAYTAALNGVDTIIFTAGIGENNAFARSEICKQLSYLGVKLDEEKNKKNEEIISAPDSNVTIKVKVTDEALVIANEVLPLL